MVVKDNEVLKKLKEENEFLKSILGNYEKLNSHVLTEGIQKLCCIKIWNKSWRERWRKK